MAVLGEKRFYKTKARIFRDSDIECTIRWFQVPDGTPFLPVQHYWAGRPWRYDRTPPTIGVGELEQSPLVWDAGIPPANPSDWVGEDDWWMNGVPISALSGPPPLHRPGNCGPVTPSACMTKCPQCPIVSAVWAMEYFPPIGELTSDVLVKTGDPCDWSNQCYRLCDRCKKGTASAWSIEPESAIVGLGKGIIVAKQGCRFTNCCS
jgi:hypothetical protein